MNYNEFQDVLSNHKAGEPLIIDGDLDLSNSMIATFGRQTNLNKNFLVPAMQCESIEAANAKEILHPVQSDLYSYKTYKLFIGYNQY